jgi:3-oxoacyl-[acyl-carrier protein] reductase
MDLGLAGRVALVTGGSKGIGRACALGLAAEGCRVAIAARGADALREAAAELEKAGAEALAVPADLAEAGGARAVVDAVVGRFGRLDVLVNNAGAIRAATSWRRPPSSGRRTGGSRSSATCAWPRPPSRPCAPAGGAGS